MKETSTQEWRRRNRAKFTSDDEFAKWQRERKARYRATHPDQYKAELARNLARYRQRHPRHDSTQNVPQGITAL